jgi:CubicO group peptidase (beta-lactamase class C family)
MKKSIQKRGIYPLPYLIAIIISISLLLNFLNIGNANAQSNLDDEVTRKFDNTVPDLLAKYSVPGASISYISYGKIVFSKGYGVKSILSHSKTDCNTIYEVGSNGKMLVAYIWLKLANEGKLNIDEPIVNYIKDPWIKDDLLSKKITVRQLLSHTSGLSNSFEVFVDKKIHFEPGSKYCYSGVGYMYLQKIIENITGKSFEEIAEKYVFVPLDMNSSSFVRPNKFFRNAASPNMDIKLIFMYTLIPFLFFFAVIYILGFVIGLISKFKYYLKSKLFIVSLLLAFIADIAIFILLNLSKMIIPIFLVGIIFTTVTIALRAITKKIYLSAGISLALLLILAFLLKIHAPIGNDIIPTRANPAFSLKSTSDDMIKFTAELINEFYSDTSSIKDLFKEQVEVDKTNGWGLGIGIDKKQKGVTYWHSGINPGSQSLVVIDVKNKNGIVILTNSDTGLDFAKEVARLTLNIDGEWNIKR